MMHVKPPRQVVLVVDDSPDMLSMLVTTLEESGMTVLVATAGAQALRSAEKMTPDVILMDAMMPEMDGFETTRLMRENVATAHIPIMFMTGLSETENIVRGFQAGGTDYVTKPIVPDVLVARIRAHLANAQKTSSARAALDAAGRFLLAVDPRGRIEWITPQATQLLETVLDTPLPATLPPATAEWLNTVASERDTSDERGFTIPSADGSASIQLTFVAHSGPEEILLRVRQVETQAGEAKLQQKFALTRREAEVLFWIAQGKANRDIASILGMSPRTVNKHLEQVFFKLGVENRTMAASAALRALGE
ncbi:alkaline phosphatase synthesis transcriptional regulatory protein PhoP [Variibacter gotjawalensis]|uniref:Alkaline phosphatase synthesis transcriptional regulatory protein PhoP n=1 Tax=Variibacter gotjawalensis TaxID=1333996 RepID=A0A0S3PUF9_9BRAD|nr:DNA-binding response regulator [Variibacter gotjawalensis]NIK49901.1 DNA-binding NarL/FixJ family response regulator [Variibacter gotjawalensis]RZS45900.1 LuxR family two component transcriptional regulator [Variibacter gotjawalensis]BAT59575.1 alkaline phosphatase synthesis transcriptional regulatory protein PhoP [Variibacter gotjawalensis]